MAEDEDYAAMPPERRRDKIKALAKKAVTVPLWVRTSDLPVRVASAVVMIAVAGAALWAGGLIWQIFVGIVVLGVIWEFSRLVFRITSSIPMRTFWLVAGAFYIACAANFMAYSRVAYGVFNGWNPYAYTAGLLGLVICVDVGAYFAGRAIGGPKIAPRISPSKTWAGLVGGALAATLFYFFYEIWAYGWWAEAINHECQFLGRTGDCTPSFERWLRITDIPNNILEAVLIGIGAAILAQSGDFFESWLKRKAGVKDSSNLIPGHGGIFDRVDGLLAVCFIPGLFLLWSILT